MRCATILPLFALAVTAPAGYAAVRPGIYRCSSMPGLAHMHAVTPEAFTVTSSADYTDAGGHAGKYSFDPNTRRVTFHSGPMKGMLMGADILYDSTAERLTFAPPTGEVVLSCSRQP